MSLVKLPIVSTRGHVGRKRVLQIVTQQPRKSLLTPPKTRCDEVPGTEGSQCVSCRRNNQMCEFSREPQKRGPSKGLDLELA